MSRWHYGNVYPTQCRHALRSSNCLGQPELQSNNCYQTEIPNSARRNTLANQRLVLTSQKISSSSKNSASKKKKTSSPTAPLFKAYHEWSHERMSRYLSELFPIPFKFAQSDSARLRPLPPSKDYRWNQSIWQVVQRNTNAGMDGNILLHAKGKPDGELCAMAISGSKKADAEKTLYIGVCFVPAFLFSTLTPDFSNH